MKWMLENFLAKQDNPYLHCLCCFERAIVDVCACFLRSEFEARKDAMGPTGFGNTPVAEDKSSDFWGSAWSNLSTGWNSFTESASTFATYTSEKAQKAGSSFQENVWKPTSEKVHSCSSFRNITYILTSSNVSTWSLNSTLCHYLFVYSYTHTYTHTHTPVFHTHTLHMLSVTCTYVHMYIFTHSQHKVCS